MKINMHEFNECLAGLAGGDPATRRKGVGGLAKYSTAEWEKSPDAVTAAVEALLAVFDRAPSKCADAPTRAEAAKAMGNLGPHAPAVVPVLLRLLQDDPDA